MILQINYYHRAHPNTLTMHIRVGASHLIVTVPSTSLSQKHEPEIFKPQSAFCMMIQLAINLKFLFTPVIFFKIQKQDDLYIITNLVGPNLSIVYIVVFVTQVIVDHIVHLFLHEGTDVVKYCLLLLAHLQTKTIIKLKSQQSNYHSCFTYQQPLSLHQLLFYSIQLLFTSFHCFEISQHPLPCLIIVCLYFLHFIGDSLDNLCLSLPQFFHFCPIIILQLFLKFLNFEFILLLLFHSYVSNLKIAYSINLILQLFFIPFIDLTFIFEEPYFTILYIFKPHHHLVFKVVIYFTQLILQTNHSLMIVSLHRNFSSSLNHPTFGHNLLNNCFEQRLLLLSFNFENAFQLFVRKIMLGVISFW